VVRQAEVTFAPGQHRYTKRFARYVLELARHMTRWDVAQHLEAGAVVFVGDGKSADALDPSWKRLRRSRARIRAVALDMSQAYINAVRAHLPQATLVFDHFHVVKLGRREAKKKEVLKGTRWLLLKNPGKLDANRDEAHRLRPTTTSRSPPDPLEGTNNKIKTLPIGGAKGPSSGHGIWAILLLPVLNQGP
jgi:transposase